MGARNRKELLLEHMYFNTYPNKLKTLTDNTLFKLENTFGNSLENPFSAL